MSDIEQIKGLMMSVKSLDECSDNRVSIIDKVSTLILNNFDEYLDNNINISDLSSIYKDKLQI